MDLVALDCYCSEWQCPPTPPPTPPLTPWTHRQALAHHHSLRQRAVGRSRLFSPLLFPLASALQFVGSLAGGPRRAPAPSSPPPRRPAVEGEVRARAQAGGGVGATVTPVSRGRGEDGSLPRARLEVGKRTHARSASILMHSELMTQVISNPPLSDPSRLTPPFLSPPFPTPPF